MLLLKNGFIRLTLILFFAGASLSAATFGDFEYELINAGTEVSITSYLGSDSHALVPNTIDSKNVTMIGESAFAESEIETITLPEHLTIIDVEAFLEAESLTSISLPSGVTEIREYAFELCAALETLDLSDALTLIEEGAFKASGITYIQIPAATENIEDEAFLLCEALTAIDVDAENAYYQSDHGVLLNADGTVLHYYPAQKAGDYSVPDTVTQIDNYAFYKSVLLEELVLPEGLTSIGQYCFNGSGLTKTIIPSTITTIPYNAFLACTNLEAILFPDTLTSITRNAFEYCTSLKQISLPDSITNIGQNAFYYCTSLTDAKLPSNLSTISSRVFSRCQNLRWITIPESITYVDSYAFEYCDQLTLVFLGDAPTIGTNPLRNTPSVTNVYYLSGATGFDVDWSGKTPIALDATKYQGASPWLISYGLDYDADVEVDLNQDGVPLLLAYALGLNPTENLATQLPILNRDGDQVSLSYFEGTSGVTYQVEASDDLSDWESIPVSYSTLDADFTRSGYVDASSYEKLFLRLKVAD